MAKSQLNQVYEWSNAQINTPNNRLRKETAPINAACVEHLPPWGMTLNINCRVSVGADITPPLTH